MKKELINTIRILGIGLKELVIEIDLGFFVIHTIEYRAPDDVILHTFRDGDVDIEINFDDLDYQTQRYIFNLVTVLLYN